MTSHLSPLQQNTSKQAREIGSICIAGRVRKTSNTERDSALYIALPRVYLESARLKQCVFYWFHVSFSEISIL